MGGSGKSEKRHSRSSSADGPKFTRLALASGVPVDSSSACSGTIELATLGVPADLSIPDDASFREWYADVVDAVNNGSSDSLRERLEYLTHMVTLLRFDLRRSAALRWRGPSEMSGGAVVRLLSENHARFLMQNVIPSVVQHIIAKQYDDDGLGDALVAVEFLKRVAVLLCDTLYASPDDFGSFSELDVTWRRIFDSQRSLYFDTSDVAGVPTREPEEKEFASSESSASDQVKGTGMSRFLPSSRGSGRHDLHDVSPFYLQIVNFVGTRGGLDIMLMRIRDHGEDFSIARFRSLLQGFACIAKSETLLPDLRNKYLAEAVALTMNTFSVMKDDQLRTLEHREFLDIVDSLRIIAGRTPKYVKDVHRLIEEFCLEFALRCLKCSVLEKRVQGMRHISDVCEHATNRKRYAEDPYRYTYAMRTSYLTTDIVSEWLLKNEIVDEVFVKPTAHPEIINPNSRLLLEFLALRASVGGLKDDVIMDKIWSAVDPARSPHRSIIDATYDVLGLAANRYTVEQIQDFLLKVEALPPPIVTAGTVGFAKILAFVTNAITMLSSVSTLWKLSDPLRQIPPVETAKSKKEKGLSLMDRMRGHKRKGSKGNAGLDDRVPEGLVPSPVRAIAQGVLEKLMNHYLLESKRKPLLDDFILRTNMSRSSLRAARAILDTFPEGDIETTARGSASESSSTDLASAIGDDFMDLGDEFRKDYRSVRYHETRFTVLTELQNDRDLATNLLESALELVNSPSALSDSPFFNIDDVIDQIQARFDFLRYASRCSAIARAIFDNVELFNAIWVTFVISQPDARIQGLGFEWVSSLLHCTGIDEIPSGSTRPRVCDIFADKICKLNLSRLTSVGFMCFRDYFIAANTVTGACARVKSSNAGDSAVPLHMRVQLLQMTVDKSLLGLEELWSIAIGAENTDVASDASDFFVRLHVSDPESYVTASADPDSDREAQELCLDILTRCTREIESVENELASSSVSSRIRANRAVRMVTHLTLNCPAPPLRRYVAHARGRQVRLEIDTSGLRLADANPPPANPGADEHEYVHASADTVGVVDPPPTEVLRDVMTFLAYSNDSVGLLRHELAIRTHVNAPFLELKFVADGNTKKLLPREHDFRTIVAAGICPEPESEEILRLFLEMSEDAEPVGEDRRPLPTLAPVTSPSTFVHQTHAEPTEEERLKAAQVTAICVDISLTAALISVRSNQNSVEASIGRLFEDEVHKEACISDAERVGDLFEDRAPDMTPSAIVRSPEGSSVAPAVCVSVVPNFYHSMFELMRFGSRQNEATSKDGVDVILCFELMKKLPTDPMLLDKLSSIGEDGNVDLAFDEEQPTVDWDQLLPSSPGEVYQLLYALQHIAVLVDSYHPDVHTSFEEDIVDDRARIKWTRGFLHSGGFSHVFELFLQAGQKIHSSDVDAVPRDLLPLLMRIISTFMESDTSIVDRTISERARAQLAHSGETLQRAVNFDEFIRMTLLLLGDLGASADADALKPAMSLLVSSIVSRPSLAAILTDFKELGSTVLGLVLESASPTVRTIACAGFKTLCTQVDALRSLLLSIQLDNLTRAAASPCCEQFFQLLSAILTVGDVPATATVAAREVVRAVNAFTFEPADNLPPPEAVVGLLKLLAALLRNSGTSRETRRMFTEKCEDQLFSALFVDPTVGVSLSNDISPAASVFDRPEARHAAFDVLFASSEPTDYVERNPSQRFAARLLEIHSRRKDNSDWSDPHVAAKSATGRVGLRNLGATCYVNSLMQQIYAIPEFRQCVFSTTLEQFDAEHALPPETDPALVTYTARMRDLLSELQRMFASLRYSDEQNFSPRKFCESVRYEGSDTAVITFGQQQDASEFFDHLRSNLEFVFPDERPSDGLREGPKQTIVQRLLQGNFESSYEARGCGHIRRIKEDFFAIQVDVRSGLSLEEALTHWMKPERIDSFRCESCKPAKEVAVDKSTAIAKLPPVLVFHLKRFAFDFARGTSNKINDYFAFPRKIDMKPYLVDAAPISNTEFELRGIVVHSGSAQGGHYVSIVRDKVDPGERWLCYDDSTVSEFDIAKQLEEECFGGSRTKQGGVGQEWQQRQRTAYMLFYELKGKIGEIEPAQGPNLQEITRQIAEANFALNADRQVFDSEYFTFLDSFVERSLATADSLQTFQLAAFFTLDTVVRTRSRDNGALWKRWMNRLTNCLTPSAGSPRSFAVDCATWLLNTTCYKRRSWLRWGVLESFDEYVRKIMVALFRSALTTLAQHDADAIVVEARSQETMPIPESVADEFIQSNDMFIENAQTSSTRFFELILYHLEISRNYWRQFAEYFSLFRAFLELGPEHRLYCALRRHHSLAEICVEFYMGPYSPYRRSGKPDTSTRPRLGVDGHPANLADFMDTLATCVRMHSTDAAERLGRMPERAQLVALAPGESLPPSLSTQAAKLFFSASFFSSFLRQEYSIKATSAVVRHLCWEDRHRTLWVMEIIMQSLSRASHAGVAAPFAALESLLEVSDSLTIWRVGVAFSPEVESNSVLDMMHYYRERHPRFVQACLKNLIRLVHMHPLVAAYLYASRDAWIPWIYQFGIQRVAQVANRDNEIRSLMADVVGLRDGKLELRVLTKNKRDYASDSGGWAAQWETFALNNPDAATIPHIQTSKY